MPPTFSFIALYLFPLSMPLSSIFSILIKYFLTVNLLPSLMYIMQMKVIPIPPDCTMHSNAALLSGDFKTRHPLLGSEGSTIGQSGKVYFDYLRNTNDPILLLCLLEKTLSERQIMQYGSIQSAHTPKHCERNPVLCIIFPFCKSSPPSNAFVPPNIMMNSFKGLAAGMKTCS